jgi:FeS assembly SUF system protein
MIDEQTEPTEDVANEDGSALDKVAGSYSSDPAVDAAPDGAENSTSSEGAAFDPATEPTLVVPTSEELEGLPPESEPVIRATIIDGIKAIYDPEIPVNIWELGLIYKIDVNDDKDVNVEMTLTSPMCPTAQQLVGQVEMAARETPCVNEVNVDLVWEPPWDMEKMSEEARLMLGF